MSEPCSLCDYVDYVQEVALLDQLIDEHAANSDLLRLKGLTHNSSCTTSDTGDTGDTGGGVPTFYK